jgi:hypothetical protein
MGGREFMAGIQIADYWPGDESGFQVVDSTSQAILRTKANWVQIAPPWNYRQHFPLPLIENSRELIPGYPDASLRGHVQNLKSQGFKVLFRIQVCCNSPTPEEIEGVDSAWWDVWFQQYENFVLYHANLSREEGVDAILLDWSSAFAVPSPQSGGPADYVERWTALMGRARHAYSGPFGIDMVWGSSVGSYGVPWPYTDFKPILHLFDFLGIAIWGGLSDNFSPTQDLLDQNAEALLTGTFDPVTAETGLPVIISGVAFPSCDGASTNSFGGNDPNFSAEFGPESRITMLYDGIEQAMVYQGLLKAIAHHPGVIGMYPFHYNWTSLPLGQNVSIRGKAAEKVVTEWYTFIQQ